jgi:prepilin-type N-terminal cleavage/methylation domain-containing protein
VKKLRNKNKAGFTLIELLVVIAIIGLLASVVLLALNSARAKSRDAKRLADLRQVASAFELYFNDVYSYPTMSTVGGGLLSSVDSDAADINIAPTYLGILPIAPLPADGSCLSGTGGPNLAINDYWMFNNVAGGYNLTAAYTISFCLGAATGGYTAGSHDLSQSGIY